MILETIKSLCRKNFDLNSEGFLSFIFGDAR